MHRTPKSTIDEQLLKNPISENIDEAKGLTIGIEVMKLGKTVSHSDIENLNKESDEKDHIDKGDLLDKKNMKIYNKDYLAVMIFWYWE